MPWVVTWVVTWVMTWHGGGETGREGRHRTGMTRSRGRCMMSTHAGGDPGDARAGGSKKLVGGVGEIARPYAPHPPAIHSATNPGEEMRESF